MRDCSTTQFRGYFDRASDRASLTFHDLKRDDAPASPLLPSFPHPFPRKEDARCSAGGWLVLVIYLQTVRGERAVDDHHVCDTVFVLRFTVKPARIYVRERYAGARGTS